MQNSIYLFGMEIHLYGLLIATGIVCALLTGAIREKHYGLPKDTALDLVLYGVPAAIVGARLYFVAFSWEHYANGPLWRVFAIWEGGLAIYGGLIAALLAGALYARVRKLRFLTLADLAAPCIALGQCIGRWGNYVNAEAHGGLVTIAALRFFPMAVPIDGQWYYATFFYESVWCLIIVIVLLALERKKQLKRPGDGFLLYAFLYAAERFFVEGLRTDSLYLGPVRVSRALSALVMLAIAIWVRVRGRACKK